MYFDRKPYAKVDALHVTRFLGFAPVRNNDKQKFIHAISPTPALTMSKTEFSAKPPITTSCPYANVDKAAYPMEQQRGPVILILSHSIRGMMYPRKSRNMKIVVVTYFALNFTLLALVQEETSAI